MFMVVRRGDALMFHPALIILSIVSVIAKFEALIGSVRLSFFYGTKGDCAGLCGYTALYQEAWLFLLTLSGLVSHASNHANLGL